MSDQPFGPVQRIDARALQAAIREAGGPDLELVELLAGGEVGAWLVRCPDGHQAALTWSPPLRPGQPPNELARVQALMEIARDAGIPAPRYEAVLDLGERGVAILQERASGRLPHMASPGLMDRLLELAEIRRGLLRGSEYAQQASPLYLSHSGPGYCLHEPLRSYSTRSATLLEAIEARAADGDALVGDDLVHYDYHLGNVLIDEERPEVVTAILDWDGARSGWIAIDLALLAFDLTLRGPQSLQRRVEDYLVTTTASELLPRVWAHVGLRLVDWSIRHHDHDVTNHWLQVAEDHVLQ